MEAQPACCFRDHEAFRCVANCTINNVIAGWSVCAGTQRGVQPRGRLSTCQAVGQLQNSCGVPERSLTALETLQVPVCNKEDDDLPPCLAVERIPDPHDAAAGVGARPRPCAAGSHPASRRTVSASLCTSAVHQHRAWQGGCAATEAIRLPLSPRSPVRMFQPTGKSYHRATWQPTCRYVMDMELPEGVSWCAHVTLGCQRGFDRSCFPNRYLHTSSDFAGTWRCVLGVAPMLLLL